MEGCASCISTVGAHDDALEQIKSEAKAYATEKQVPVAIVREGQDYRFYEAEYAIKNGFNIINILSQY